MPEISGLFIYRLVFLFELLVSEGLFFFKVKRKNHFWWRLSGSLLVIVLVTLFYPIPFYNWWYTSLMFVVIFGLTMCAAWICFAESFSTIAFLSVASYLVQHIAYQGLNSILCFSGLNNSSTIGIYGQKLPTANEFSIITTIINIVVYIAIYFFCFVLFANQIKKNSEIMISSGYMILFVGFLLVVIVGINSYIVYSVNDEIPYIFMGFFDLLSFFCCFLSLSFMFKLLDQRQMKTELDDAYEIIRQEKRQYELSKNNIDLINRRVHDLKHQMQAIISNENVKKEVVNEMTSAIKIYDSSIKTGNKVLDTIMTEKSLECSQKNIKITCLLDGKKLNFMSELDLYTFFGNALDNAIESVSKLSEDKRAISLTMTKKGNFISLVIQNYTDNKIVPIKDNQVNTFIKTSKEDPLFHGFGMRSMENIAEKYGGNINFEISDGIFYLYALFVDKEVTN